jgi:cytochrome c biogenesis factor
MSGAENKSTGIIDIALVMRSVVIRNVHAFSSGSRLGIRLIAIVGLVMTSHTVLKYRINQLPSSIRNGRASGTTEPDSPTGRTM